MIEQVKTIVPNSKVIIISGYSDFSYAQPGLLKTAGADLISQMISVLNRSYHQKDLSLRSVSHCLHSSQSYLSRGIKQKTGMGFSDYLNNLRLKQARFLLSHRKDLSILEISDQVGGSSQHYFCRVFKNVTGSSPSEYRALPQDGGGDIP